MKLGLSRPGGFTPSFLRASLKGFTPSFLRASVHGMWIKKLLGLCVLSVLCVGAIYAHAAKNAQAKGALQRLPWLEASAYDASKYVGSETCKGCHEAVHKDMSLTAHGKIFTEAKWKDALQGCESCHGPGTAHVEGMGDKTKIFSFKDVSGSDKSAVCLRCHTEQSKGENLFHWEQSQHARNEVACVDCHNPHGKGMGEFLLRGSQPNLCYTCHNDVRIAFNMPFHHKVPERGMKCTDCHNTHGTTNLRQVSMATATDSACFQCHTDKQGPFTFEHWGVRVEGCMACHTPHGSANPRLLKRADVRLVCLECHTDTGAVEVPGTPSFHNQATVRFQQCTTCHVRIHGSNADRVFFR